MEGMTKAGEFGGDFGTPEQQIPATGLIGVDWETCMTMNDHWGYNKNDINWKSTEDLLRKLADIASKGGNFLLNVGPTSEGLFPQASVERLQEIGSWMKVNGEAIYGTSASPFKNLEWGRCTQKNIKNGTRLYMHVFNWPADGKLIVPGIYNQPKKATLLSDPRKKSLHVARQEDALVISVPAKTPDPYNSVVVLDLLGKADVNDPPDISADFDIFVRDLNVSITTNREKVEVRYTLDGSSPSVNSELVNGPIRLNETTVVSARCFRNGKPVSGVAQGEFTKVEPRPASKPENLDVGLRYDYYEGDWDSLPNFSSLKPVQEGSVRDFDVSVRKEKEYFGLEYTGFISIPEDGVYGFFTDSDDGSRLYIGDTLVVDNDGLHGLAERKGVIALAAGLHPIRVTFFQKTGGVDLRVYYQGPNIAKRSIPDEVLFHKK
jgi:alpha-L-fucosidase